MTAAALALAITCSINPGARTTLLEPNPDQVVDGARVEFRCLRTARWCDVVVAVDGLPVDVFAVRSKHARRHLGAIWLCPGPVAMPDREQWWPAAEPTPIAGPR